MIGNIFDVLLCIYFILCCTFLVVGNTLRFMYWLKRHNAETSGEMHYCRYFWNNEWGSECTMEELENLKEMVRQFEENNKMEKR